MDGPGASRRTILRSGVLAIGALAGVLGFASVADRVKSGTLLSPAPAGTTSLTLHGTNWRLTAPGLRRGDLPRRGDQVSVSGAVSYDAGAEPVGTFMASVLHMDAAQGHGPYAGVQMETHTFQLPEGNLIGMGSSGAGGQNVFAIVGGTGRFLGVTGSYVGTQSPLETGGDGTAEFTLTIHSGR